MTNYIIKRIILGFISLIGLIILVYFLMSLTDRNPIDKLKYKTDAEYLAVINKFHLNDSLLSRFWRYFSGLFTLNFGDIYNETGADNVPAIFFSPLKYTILITSISFAISVIVGITLGFIAGYNSGKWLDNLIGFVVVMFMAVPSFILASVMLILGPKMGFPTAFLEQTIFGAEKFYLSLIAPILVMTLGSISGFTYYTRNEIKSILSSDYILNAKSKGLSGFTIFRKYVLRNSLIPIVSIVVPSFVILLGGSFVIETFFGVPGSSTVIISAIKENEINIVMFNVIFFGSISIIISIIVDVLYVVVDPRIKYSTASANNLKLINRFKTFWFDPKRTKEEKGGQHG